MVEAFVLIQVDLEAGEKVGAEVGKVPGIRISDVVTGPYDVVARAQAADLAILGGVVDEIQRIPGVVRTMTCPILHF